jgi:hypothetical protein
MTKPTLIGGRRVVHAETLLLPDGERGEFYAEVGGVATEVRMKVVPGTGLGRIDWEAWD